MKLWVVILIGFLLIVVAGFLGGLIGIPWVRYLLFGIASGIFGILLARRIGLKHNHQPKRKE